MYVDPDGHTRRDAMIASGMSPVEVDMILNEEDTRRKLANTGPYRSITTAKSTLNLVDGYTISLDYGDTTIFSIQEKSSGKLTQYDFALAQKEMLYLSSNSLDSEEWRLATLLKGADKHMKDLLNAGELGDIQKGSDYYNALKYHQFLKLLAEADDLRVKFNSIAGAIEKGAFIAYGPKYQDNLNTKPYLDSSKGYNKLEKIENGQIIGPSNIVPKKVPNPGDPDFIGPLPNKAGVGGGTPRTFVGKDKYVGDIANRIEAKYPGSVKSVEVNENSLLDGKPRELDIILNDGTIIQVKEGNARGLNGQLTKTKDHFPGRKVIGVHPDEHSKNVKNAIAKDGNISTDSIDDLVDNMLNHLGGTDR